MTDGLSIVEKAQQFIAANPPELKKTKSSTSTNEDEDYDYKLELDLKRFFPEKSTRVPFTDLNSRVKRAVDMNPEYFDCAYPDSGKKRRPEVSLRHALDVKKLRFGTCREALQMDLNWLNLKKEAKCVADLEKSGTIFVAPLHFIPPRCVLASTLQGNMNSERANYIQDVAFHWERANNGFKPMKEIRPGRACIIRKSHDIIRAVIVGQGVLPGTFHCICLDFNAFADMEAKDIYKLPDELNTKQIASSLFLAKVNNMKWTPSKLVNELVAVINTKYNAFRAHDVYAGYMFGMKSEKDIMPDLEWVHENSEWFSTYIQKFEEHGLLLTPDKKRVPMTVSQITDEVRKVIQSNYGFNLTRDGHPKYPPPAANEIYSAPNTTFNARKILSLDGIAEELFELYEKPLVLRRSSGISPKSSDPKENKPLLPPITPSSSVDLDSNSTRHNHKSSVPTELSPLKQSSVAKQHASTGAVNLMSLYDWVQGVLPQCADSNMKFTVKACALSLASSYVSILSDEDPQLTLILEGIASL